MARTMPPPQATQANDIIGAVNFLSAGPRVDPTRWIVPVDGYDISITPVEGAGNIEWFLPDMRHQQNLGMGQVARMLFDYVAASDHLLDIFFRNPMRRMAWVVMRYRFSCTARRRAARSMEGISGGLDGFQGDHNIPQPVCEERCRMRAPVFILQRDSRRAPPALRR